MLCKIGLGWNRTTDRLGVYGSNITVCFINGSTRMLTASNEQVLPSNMGMILLASVRILGVD